MEPYEESAIQETEPEEDTYQAMLHGICTSACDVGAMSAVLLVPGLLGRRRRRSVACKYLLPGPVALRPCPAPSLRRPHCRSSVCRLIPPRYKGWMRYWPWCRCPRVCP